MVWSIIRRVGLPLGALVVAAGLAACGSSGGGAGNGHEVVKAQQGYTAGLPPSVASLYSHAADVLGPSAYSKWKAVKPPWTLCFNNSYLGNTWRETALTEFNKLAEQYKSAGLVSKFLSTNSNLELPTQLQQMRDTISVDHCSGIITIPTGTSGMNTVIEQAYRAGIPVVDDLGPTTTPYAENFDESWYVSGVKEAEFLVHAMHEEGNMLDVLGIPGETINVEYQAGLKSVLNHYPKVHLIGQVTGKVTDSIAQGAVLQFLSTHPQPIKAVFQEGGMGAGIIEAFKQTKRPLPALVLVGSGSTVALLHEAMAKGEKPKFYGLTDPPGWTMQQSFLILMRLLEGQHPKNVTIFYKPPEITESNLSEWWKPEYTPSTTKWPEPPTNPMPTGTMNEYFINGKAPLPYEGKG